VVLAVRLHSAPELDWAALRHQAQMRQLIQVAAELVQAVIRQTVFKLAVVGEVESIWSY
jgi:hypothetical protein